MATARENIPARAIAKTDVEEVTDAESDGFFIGDIYLQAGWWKDQLLLVSLIVV